MRLQNLRSGNNRSCGCLRHSLSPPPAVRGARWVALNGHRFTLVDVGDYERVAAKRWSYWRGTSADYAVHYYMDGAKERRLHLHRFILNVDTFVDHRNGDGLDNRRSNLRQATHAQNSANQKVRDGAASRFKGVTPWLKGWRARIGVNYKTHHIGCFKTEEEAARAYDEAAIAAFGEFARLNFPRRRPRG